MATAYADVSNGQLSEAPKPGHLPAPIFTPHEVAVEYLRDFAGCYAINPAARRTLQQAIQAAAPQNNPIAPSERATYINSAVAYFRPIVEKGAALEPSEVERRLDQLQRSLAGLSEAFELPPVSIASQIEMHRPPRARQHADHAKPLTSYREAKAFLQDFSDRFAQAPHDQELLQAAISLAARRPSPLAKADHDVARNEILRHFEHKVRRTLLAEAALAGESLDDPKTRARLMSDAADKAESLNLKLGTSLRQLQYGFSLEGGASHGR